MKGASEKFKRIGIDITLRLSSELNTLLGINKNTFVGTKVFLFISTI
jgi:hypothetical protein